MKTLRIQWKWYSRHSADIGLLASLIGLASIFLLFALY